MKRGVRQTAQRHVDGELITYMPEPTRVRATSSIVNSIVNLLPGQKAIITIEPLGESDDSCVAGSFTVKDGPGKQVFPDLLFKISAATLL